MVNKDIVKTVVDDKLIEEKVLITTEEQTISDATSEAQLAVDVNVYSSEEEKLETVNEPPKPITKEQKEDTEDEDNKANFQYSLF